jgi:hypothetical protein
MDECNLLRLKRTKYLFLLGNFQPFDYGTVASESSTLNGTCSPCRVCIKLKIEGGREGGGARGGGEKGRKNVSPLSLARNVDKC